MSAAASSSTNAPAAAARLLVKRIKDNAVVPVRKSALAAGYDLSSCENKTIPSGGTVLVKTGLQIACPEGTYGRVAPRSGLAYKHSIDVGAGVVDADYRGEVGVILFNFGKKDFEVKEGDRIAQLVLEKIALAEVEEVQDLTETARGSGGFGSTGVESSAGPAPAAVEESANKKQRTISPAPEGGEATKAE